MMLGLRRPLRTVLTILGTLTVLWVVFTLSKLNRHARNITWSRQVQPSQEAPYHSRGRILPSHSSHPPASTLHLQEITPKAAVATSKAAEATSRTTTFNPPTAAKPALKPTVYIYDLPKKFNEDILNCVLSPIASPSYHQCFDFANDGIGAVLFRQSNMVVCDSNQFSLEVIVHRHLMSSRHRTLDPAEADLFYIPAYMGLLCFCQAKKPQVNSIIRDFFAYLNTQPPWLSRRPHISTLSKIEREQLTHSCPLLRYPETHRVTYIGIEQEVGRSSRRFFNRTEEKMIVAPYPSYVHFDPTPSELPPYQWPPLEERNIFLFFAASNRRSNGFRAKLIDQFPIQTRTSYEEFMAGNLSVPVEQVMLITQECMGNHKNTTIPWMQHAVFCLQPSGDSPTRKSFFDSVLSGCIPVIFNYSAVWNVKYPFDSSLDYRNFTVMLQASDVDTVNTTLSVLVLSKLKEIPQTEIAFLHENLVKIAHLLQYSFPSSKLPLNASMDAFEMILQEAASMYDLT